jgi:DNA repair protein RadC
MGTSKMEVVKEIVRIKQVVKTGEVKREKITTPKDAVEIATKYIGDEDREVLLVLVLNTKNQINAIHRCHIGSLNSSIVHPREVMKAAIRNNGASIIIAHNHPSYDPTESREDVELTKRIQEAGRILGIDLLDHLIVTDDVNRYTSLKEKGVI